MIKFIKFSLLILIVQPFLYGQFFDLGANSLFSDIKAHSIGDVLTVYIMESANASQQSKKDESQKTENSASGTITGSLTGFLPVFGANAGLGNSHSGSKETKQNDRLTGKISAVIIDKLDNGLLEIEGERLVEVNGERNMMTINGLVRSRDIEDNNIVYSYKIANAKIVYKKSEDSRLDKLKPGTIQKVSTWVLSGIMITMAIFGSGAI